MLVDSGFELITEATFVNCCEPGGQFMLGCMASGDDLLHWASEVATSLLAQ